MSAHFSRILRPRMDFFSGCSDMFLFFSRLRSSWNSSLTLWLVLADVSMKWQPHRRASASPSSAETSRVSFSSHLLPTNMIGIDGSSAAPLVSLITCHIGRSSSSDCLDVHEYTNMNAWPLDMDNRCMAGNWCDPVVSVICSVQMFLLQLITCRYVSSMVGMYDSRNVPLTNRSTSELLPTPPAPKTTTR